MSRTGVTRLGTTREGSSRRGWKRTILRGCIGFSVKRRRLMTRLKRRWKRRWRLGRTRRRVCRGLNDHREKLGAKVCFDNVYHQCGEVWCWYPVHSIFARALKHGAKVNCTVKGSNMYYRQVRLSIGNPVESGTQLHIPVRASAQTTVANG